MPRKVSYQWRMRQRAREFLRRHREEVARRWGAFEELPVEVPKRPEIIELWREAKLEETAERWKEMGLPPPRWKKKEEEPKILWLREAMEKAIEAMEKCSYAKAIENLVNAGIESGDLEEREVKALVKDDFKKIEEKWMLCTPSLVSLPLLFSKGESR